jgi:hypothetical protein
MKPYFASALRVVMAVTVLTSAISLVVLTQRHKPAPAQVATTLHRLRMLDLFANDIAHDMKVRLGPLLFNNSESPPHVQFLQLLKQYTNQFGGTFSTNIIIDGWSRAFLFTNDLGPLDAVRIWSSGPNGINELGQGDDIGWLSDR